MLKQVIEAHELLDDARIDGKKVSEFLKDSGLGEVSVKRAEGKGKKRATDFVKVMVPGKEGKKEKGKAPTIGIIGRLGGIGARPECVGMVSDADGAIAAISCALKLADMNCRGDMLKGDVIIATHICPGAPTQPHKPVPFMGSPVDMATMNRYEVDPAMDAILSVDTTKGNRIINVRGFAITPTVKEGWILKISEDLLDIMQIVTGKLPVVVPITMQDITPYENGVYHVNSILQPATATNAPVAGVAITAEVPVPGCATGANNLIDIEQAAKFCIEVAKGFGEGKVRFYDKEEFKRLVKLYGSMNHLLGEQKG
ncbi:MAG TPA: DUF1177 domain-containing protein [Thermoplasmata archaeon]|nr:DUF1177 domain-containing protein [Thermoplasmata archaeon]